MKRAQRAGNPGRWRVERERCRLEDPAPPRPDGGAMSLGEALSPILKRIGLGEQHWMAALAEQWETLVGADVARHTRPGRVDRGTLFVFVDSSVWLSELVRYGSDEILAKLQKRFHKNRIRSVRFQLDPGTPARPAGPVSA